LVATARDATYLWTEFGLRFIDEARQANKPFFLYLPFNAPHERGSLDGSGATAVGRRCAGA